MRPSSDHHPDSWSPDIIILGSLVICGPKMVPGQLYQVQTPGGPPMTFLAGDLLPADSDHVWLTSLADNEPLFRVRSEHVRKASPEEASARILADARAVQAEKARRN